MKKFIKTKLIFMLFMCLTIVLAPKVLASGNISISAPSNAVVGDTITISVNNDSSGNYALTGDLVITGGASGSKSVAIPGAGSESIKVKVNSSQTIQVRFSGNTALTAPPFSEGNVTRTRTINVSNQSGGGTTGNGSTGSYKPLAPKETEAEQKAREEAEAKAKLEAEKKIPLVESIDFFSESERLKGEQVLSVKTENDTFKYSVTLPRNIEAFKLDLKPAGEDVTLEYEKMFKLDEGHDKVEIKAVATKGEITQEYNISVNRYRESELTYDVGDEKYNLLVDTLIDEKLDVLGIKKHLVDSEKNKDAYYYQYERLKFVLTYDSKGIAHFFFVDDQAQLAKEFILFSDEGNKPHFIVDVELEEPGTIRRNKYEKSAIDLPEFITNLDASTEFNNSVSHWKFDETGIITHELKVPAASDEAVAVDYNDVEQVYIGEGRIVSAFVNFDDSNQNMTYLAIALGSLLAVTLGIFVVYWRNTNKRINKILKRND